MSSKIHRTLAGARDTVPLNAQMDHNAYHNAPRPKVWNFEAGNTHGQQDRHSRWEKINPAKLEAINSTRSITQAQGRWASFVSMDVSIREESS